MGKIKSFEIKCKKCGSTNVFIHADENYLVTIKCLTCGNKE